MRFPLKVTRADIRDGQPGSECNCPIARAAERHVHPTLAVRVKLDGRVLVSKEGGAFRSAPSKKRRRFIEDFDMNHGLYSKPFTSIVDLPMRVLRPSTVKKFRRNRK